jgi:hypothetical protein
MWLGVVHKTLNFGKEFVAKVKGWCSLDANS